nr:hypothetical protein [Nanoarchaeum sp.]
MRKELIAIFVMFLVISSPVSALFGGLIGSDDDPRNLGEALIIEVDHIDPTPIDSSNFQNREFDAYVFLKGKTVGTMLFGDAAPEQAPFYGGMKIKSIDFNVDAEASKYISRIYFNKPKDRELIVDSNGNIDLGYARVTLKRMPVEEDVPETIDAEVNAIIWFDVMSGIGQYGATTFNLQVSPDEQAWLNSESFEESKFWNGRGYLRLKSINENRASVDVYDGMKRKVSSVTLVLNGEVQQVPLPGAASYVESFVTLKLNRVNKDVDSAKLIIEDSNGVITSNTYVVGMNLPNSEWTVSQIYKNSVVFVNPDGDKKTISISKPEVQGDPCADIKSITDLNINDASYQEMYCHAIAEFQESVDSTTNNSIKFDSNIGIANVYHSMSAYSLSLMYYQKAQENDPEKFKDYQARFSSVQDKAEKGLATIDVEDNKVSLLSTTLGEDKKDSFICNIDGAEKEIELGTAILEDVQDENDNVYDWIVKNIDSENVVLEQKFERNTGLTKQTVTLKVGQSEVIPYTGRTTKSIVIKEVKIRRSAVVTVTPGSKENYGVSNFVMHIPIAKRLWQWTPEEIDNMIESTDKTITKVTTIKDKLGSVVKTWKGMCFAVFSFLAVKNAFFNNPLGRRLAVEKWEAKCNSAVKTGENFNGKTYTPSQFEECMSDNVERIELDVEKSQEVVEQTKEVMKDFDWENKDSVARAAAELGVSTDELILMNQYNQLNAEEVRDSVFDKRFGDGFNATDFNEKKVRVVEMDTKVKAAGFDIKNPEDFQEIQNIVYSVNNKGVTTKGTEFFSSEDEIAKQIMGQYDVSYLNLDGKKVAYSITEENGKYYLYDDGTKVEIKPILKTDSTQVTSQYGSFFESVDGSKKYVGAVDRDAYSTTYKGGKPSIIYDENTKKPLCIPLKWRKTNEIPKLDYANYILVEQETVGSVYPYSVWNVGLDGQMNTQDDQLVVSSSILANPTSQEVRSLKSEIDRRYQKSNVSPDKGKKVKLGTGEEYVAQFAESSTTSAIGECRYMMSETDCKILFGVCDPVMCPASRFDFGGRWEVSNAVQSGIIGSIVLGLPNFDLPYEPVPVCLTGIHAGLENIVSMLGGFRDCLEVAKVKGESVGICNEIRSLYVCDILWQETLSLVNVFGELNKIISTKVLGKSNGGGEYLSWDSSWKQLSKSVSFFTKDYASSAFTAFQSRSTKEIGTEICKAAIFGKYPGGTDLLAQLTEPESPSQFTGWVEEDQYTQEEGGRSIYRVYYHIYAGRSSDIRYRVVLRDLTGRVIGVTDENSVNVGEKLLRKGESVDKSFSINPASGWVGFTNMCIYINGAEECGFGSVSSSFSMQYLKDMIVESQIGNITSAKNCKPGTSSYTPGFTQSGLDMRCSVYDPDGVGDDWVYTGTCGYDEKDRFQGDCYLYSKGINLKDKNYNLTQYVPLQVQDEIEEEFSSEEIVSLQTKFSELVSKDAQTTSTSGRLQVISEYREFIDSEITTEITALSYYKVGMVYYKIGKDKLKKQIEAEVAAAEESKFSECTITYDGDDIGGNERITLKFFEGMWVIVGLVPIGTYVYEYDGKIETDVSKELFRIQDENSCKELHSSKGEVIQQLCKNLVGKGYQDGLKIIVDSANSQSDDTIQVENVNKEEYKPGHNEASAFEIIDFCVGTQEVTELSKLNGEEVEINCEPTKIGGKIEVLAVDRIVKDGVEIDSEDWISSILTACGDFDKIIVKHEDGTSYSAFHSSLNNANAIPEEWLRSAVFKEVYDVYYPFELKLDVQGGTFGSTDYTFVWNGFELEKIAKSRGFTDEDKYNHVSWDKFLEVLQAYIDKYNPTSLEFKCTESGKTVDTLELTNLDILPYANVVEYLDQNSWLKNNSLKCQGVSYFESVTDLTKYINYAAANNVGGNRCDCGSNCDDYAKWIVQYSQQYSVNSLLVLALIMQESSCDQTLYSKDKNGNPLAFGLMQITEGTFDDICSDIGSFSDVKGMDNAENNIACGMKVLNAKYALWESRGSKYWAELKCDLDEYVQQYSAYTEWDAALRGYNGWGCRTGADVSYVEKIKNKVRILQQV